MEPQRPSVTPAPNPWRTIWFSPRQTIRDIVDASVRPSLIPVLSATIIAVFLNVVNTALSAPPVWRSLLRGAAFAFSVVSAYLWFAPLVLAWYARRRNAIGGSREIRQALAWGYAPFAASAVCWLPLWIATGGSAYDYEISLSPVLRVLTLPLFFAADLLAPFWSAGITVVMLAEVQRVSVWQAIEAIVIAWLVALAGFLLMALVLKAIM